MGLNSANPCQKMKNKEQVLTAIATILSADYWKTSQQIADELRSRHNQDYSADQIRRLLRKYAFIEKRKLLGYRLNSGKPDLIDQDILRLINAGENLGPVSRKFKITRQAVHQRKQKLREKAICP